MTTRKKISLVSEKEYLNAATRSGSPLLVKSAKTRSYANSNVNGTTAIVLAALAASTTFDPKKSVYTLDEYREGAASLKADRKADGKQWARLKDGWSRFGGRSKSPDAKIGPVLSALARDANTGVIRGFDATGIADEETRAYFGFKVDAN